MEVFHRSPETRAFHVAVLLKMPTTRACIDVG